MSLLKRDIRLPENCIHDFARDLAIALQVWILAVYGVDRCIHSPHAL